MVDKTNGRLNRRRILQMSGAGMAIMSGIPRTGTEAAMASASGPEHRATTAEQNKPKFAGEQRKIGFAKGGFKKPVTEVTIDALYGKVIGDNMDKKNMPLPRPTRDEDGPGTVHDVFGIVIAATDDGLDVSVDRKPIGLDALPADKKRPIEARIHQKVDNKVRSAKCRVKTGRRGSNDGAG